MRVMRVALLFVVTIVAGGGVPLVAADDSTSSNTQSGGSGLQEVILAARRDGRIVVIDPASLRVLVSIDVCSDAERAVASRDGKTIFVARTSPSLGDSCCGLFTLDLVTGDQRLMLEPAMDPALSADGRWLYAQRGNVGIDVVDAHTLERAPSMRAPGMYVLAPSPDGRWIFGTSVGAEASIDIVDVAARKVFRHLPAPRGLFMRGTWIGGRFFVYAHDGVRGNVWTVSSDSTSLGPPTPVALPPLGNDGAPVLQEVVAVGNMLAIYEPFGMKVDRRRSQAHPRIPGGAFLVDPVSGRVLRPLAPGSYFNHLCASADGRFLFGVEPSDPDWNGPTRLVKIDVADGAIVAERVLERDVWNISAGALETSLLPRLRLSRTAR